MTKDRDLKTKIRARMAKTGERYAAARANFVGSSDPAADWRSLRGAHAETTGLARLMSAAGIVAPHTGAPPGEALLLGLGGGLGGAYFVFEYKGMPPTFYVATRCYPQYAYGADFVTRAASRLGVVLEVTQTTSRVAAARQLRDRVTGAPTLAWLDRNALPWATGIMTMGTAPHVVVISAVDDDVATVHDTAGHAYRLPHAELATARAGLAREKHRLVTLRPAPPAKIDLAAATREAIADCCAELAGRTKHKQFAGNFGIAGFAKWTALVESNDKKAWPRVFAGGAALWSALASGAYWIDLAGTGGGAFRPLYARFLDEAATITGTPTLREAAEAYRALGTAWSDLAAAMLPRELPLLSATRAALDDQTTAAAAGDLDALARARDRLRQLRTRADTGELDAHAADLRAALASRLRSIVAQETAAAAALGSAT